jgi:protoporphyrinogen oxidase
MSQRIAILGAGPMGLAVAYELARGGHRPVVFEADDRIGGMSATFDFDGLEIERYYHFHCVSDVAFIDMLSELGIADKLSWAETKMGYWYKGCLQQWGNPTALLKFKGLSISAKLRYGLHAFLSTKRNNWLPLDSIRATFWIRRWVGQEAWEVLWRRLFEYKFYEYSDDLSAAWIWSRIRRIGRSRYSLFREKLGYLEGGSSTLLNAIKQDIEKNGGEIRLKAPIDKVFIKNGVVEGVQVAGEFLAFKKVVSTIPLPFITKIIPDLPTSVLRQVSNLKNIAVVCVIVKLKKQFTENFWLNTNDPDMDIPGLVEYTNLRPLPEHIVYVPFYVPGKHPLFSEKDEAFKTKVKRYLMKINPSLQNNDFIQMQVNRYRYAQPVCELGHLNNLPSTNTPIEGLWIADTSYYYPEDRGISESIEFGRRLAKNIFMKKP